MEKPMPQAHDGMTVFITGITGMIGGHVANHYRRGGARVIGIARPSAAARNQGTADAQVIACDVMDRTRLRKLLSTHQPRIIYHLAAQAFNGISWEMEETTVLTNVQGTL